MNLSYVSLYTSIAVYHNITQCCKCSSIRGAVLQSFWKRLHLVYNSTCEKAVREFGEITPVVEDKIPFAVVAFPMNELVNVSI